MNNHFFIRFIYYKIIFH